MVTTRFTSTIVFYFSGHSPRDWRTSIHWNVFLTISINHEICGQPPFCNPLLYMSIYFIPIMWLSNYSRLNMFVQRVTGGRGGEGGGGGGSSSSTDQNPQKNTGTNRVKIHKNLKTQLFWAPVMALPFEKQKKFLWFAMLEILSATRRLQSTQLKILRRGDSYIFEV